MNRSLVLGGVMFLIGLALGLGFCRVYVAEKFYRDGYARATMNLKQSFEKVVKEEAMFYAEDLGVVFVPKGGDTFEVVMPDRMGADRDK